MKQLTVLFNGRKQGTFLLDEPDVVIGRGRTAHIALDGNPIVSRKHAVLQAEMGAHIIRDLGGPNGTIVNDSQVKHARLRVGDRILLGKHTLRYEEATPEAESLRGRAQLDGLVDGGESDASKEDEIKTQAVAAVSGAQAKGGSAPWDQASDPQLDGPSTVNTTREELQGLLANMKVKSAPHLSVMKEEGLDLVPLDEPSLAIGHTPTCRVRLEGRRIFGKVAAVVEHRSGQWWLVAKAPLWNPVRVGGNRVRKQLKLHTGATIQVGDIKLRFSTGEQD